VVVAVGAAVPPVVDAADAFRLHAAAGVVVVDVDADADAAEPTVHPER